MTVKFFALPHASFGPLPFAPEVATMRVCKAWNKRMNMLLERWWHSLPDRLKSEKNAVQKQLAEGKPSYSEHFKCLNEILLSRLEELHPKTAQEMRLQFKGSLSNVRILSLDVKIFRLRLFGSRLINADQCAKVNRKFFELADDYLIPTVCKTWCKGKNQVLCNFWWHGLPKSLHAKRSPMYYDRHAKNDRKNYYALVHDLAENLSAELAKIHSKSAHAIHRRYVNSISPKRVIDLQEAITKLKCLQSVWEQAQNQSDLGWLENVGEIIEAFSNDENQQAFSQVTRIDISGKHLTKIPIELICFKRLEDLDLANNDLTHLHEVIIYFHHLRRVDLQGNPFPEKNYRSIARVIADNRNPDAFQIDLEPLKLVVQQEKECAHCLREVWKKIMPSFPDRLEGVYEANHKNLPSKARVRPSNIRALLLNPANRKFLHQIRELDLKNCNLRVLAVEMFVGLKNLRTLDLSYNPINELPYVEMERLEHLESLDLSHTGFSAKKYASVADRLADFPSLTRVVHHDPAFKFATILNWRKSSSKPSQREDQKSPTKPSLPTTQPNPPAKKTRSFCRTQ